jgi:hypothetical protein
MKLAKTSRDAFVNLARDKGVYLEGNVLKVLDAEDDEEFKAYLEEALRRDRDVRKKRLEVTKQIQTQNRDLQDAQEKNLLLMEELKTALASSETAKAAVQEDLDVLQKRTQFQLMSRIVMVALTVICGIGVTTTLMYATSMITGRDTALVGNAWSSMFGILLTNSFSIIGTIMGVKYATEGSKAN